MNEKTRRELANSFKDLQHSLKTPKLSDLEWHDNLYQKMAEITAQMNEIKKELASHLKVDEKAIEEHITISINKLGRVPPGFFSNSGSQLYNDAAKAAIRNLVYREILGIDLDWKVAFKNAKK